MQAVTKTFIVSKLGEMRELDDHVNGWIRSLGNGVQRVEFHDVLDVKEAWNSDSRLPLVRTVVVYCKAPGE